VWEEDHPSSAVVMHGLQRREGLVDLPSSHLWLLHWLQTIKQQCTLSERKYYLSVFLQCLRFVKYSSIMSIKSYLLLCERTGIVLGRIIP